ncbi:MAG: SDR family oxidoreductase [Acidobacteriota bacterium]|nr:SDR family oxidoreductase [Acidobacteriota bacterium]
MSENPKEKEPQPPFPEQQQEPPGLESEMTPAPDFGLNSYKGSGKLQDKAAIITGGDSGIGRAVALAFAREGADVLISYLPEEESDAQETRRVVESAGRRCVTVPGDIREEEQCREIINRAMQEFGKIDILINNAAYQMSHEGGIGEISSEEFDRTFKTNVYAMFYLCKAALPLMKAGSTIINTTSIQAYEPKPQLLAYAATKGAIMNFTKGLNHQAMEKGIRVNAVAPGPIWTPLIPATMPPEKTASFGQDTPMERAGQPAELAPVYVFLASDDASYISGEIIGVTGGKPLP